MLLRWGKNVKMTVKFGTGGVPTNLRKKARDGEEERRGTVASGQRDGSDRATVDASDNVRPPAPTFNRDEGQTSVAIPPSIGASVSTVVEERRVAPPKGPTYDPAKHSAEAITVIAPTDPRRLKFITTVASFVAKDGSVLVQKLIETQSFNLDFRFLTPRDDDDDAVHPFSSDNDDDDVRFEEHVFYRWRGYSFAQGDGFSSWRTDPFVMFELHGRFWIPPPLNTLAAQEEEEAEKRWENTILAAQEERRKLAGKKEDCVTTGAQMRRTNADKGGGLKLNEWEKKVFNELLREKLCASQESICEAMSFAFDKSGAALEISHFLLSDILFNSQQPGVKNAFQYRGENTNCRNSRQVSTGLNLNFFTYRCYRSDVSECVRKSRPAWRWTNDKEQAEKGSQLCAGCMDELVCIQVHIYR